MSSVKWGKTRMPTRRRLGEVIAFSTANPDAAEPGQVIRVEMLPLDRMDPLFEATVQATEEAIVNALVAAKTMRGIDDREVIALPHDRLKLVLKKYNRL